MLFLYVKIDGAIVCLSFAVSMASFGNSFFFDIQNEILCPKHIIVFFHINMHQCLKVYKISRSN